MSCDVLNVSLRELRRGHELSQEQRRDLRAHLLESCEDCLSLLEGSEGRAVLGELAGPLARLTEERSDAMFTRAIERARANSEKRDTAAPVVPLDADTRWTLSPSALGERRTPRMQLAPPTSILIVDDDAAVRDVISVLLQEEGYECRTASSAEAALDVAAAEAPPLVISDMKMPGRDGIWLLEAFRERYPETAVIMLTGYGDTEAAVDCLRRGAVDYLLKPPKLTDLIRAIERALAKRRIELARKRYQKKLERKVRDRTGELRTALRNIQGTYQTTLLALVRALDAREHETSDHSQRVVKYTEVIAERLGLRGPELEEIGRGALLHDIGKIGVPDAVLLKPAKLTPEEWKEMRRHPDIGYDMIRSIEFLNTPAAIVLSHQERFDGKGYPRCLRGEEIHIGARIFAVADTLDAMTSDRPYRRGTTFENAVAEVQRCAGSQFDPEVVRAFLDIRVKNLRRIKEDMAAARPCEASQMEQDAREAEEALDRALEAADEAENSVGEDESARVSLGRGIRGSGNSFLTGPGATAGELAVSSPFSDGSFQVRGIRGTSGGARSRPRPVAAVGDCIPTAPATVLVHSRGPPNVGGPVPSVWGALGLWRGTLAPLPLDAPRLWRTPCMRAAHGFSASPVPRRRMRLDDVAERCPRRGDGQGSRPLESSATAGDLPDPEHLLRAHAIGRWETKHVEMGLDPFRHGDRCRVGDRLGHSMTFSARTSGQRCVSSSAASGARTPSCCSWSTQRQFWWSSRSDSGP